MKISLVLPFASLAGGIRVVATFARLLQEQGHEVSIPFAPPLGQRARLKIFLGQKKHPVVASTPLQDFLEDRHQVLENARPVIAYDLPDEDIVVASWWKTAAWIAALPASKGRKFYLLQDHEVFHSQPAERVALTIGSGLT